MKNPFFQKSFLKLTDYTQSDIYQLLEIAAKLKQQKIVNAEDRHLIGKNIALIFEKDSTRTRIAFEVAAYDQGANVTYLGPNGSQMGHKESVKDTARVLGQAFDAIQYRGYAQHTVEVLSEFSGVPVYNGLTDTYHPTQGLADLLTMSEFSDKPLSETTFCFVGDCRFNMGNTSLLAGALMGMNVRLLCPDALRPADEIIRQATTLAEHSGASVLITDDADAALVGCDFVHTDVWVSMGEPEHIWQSRIALLKGYQVNQHLLAKTQREDVKFMHCLPAFHNRDTVIGEQIYQQFGLNGLEVDDPTFESDASIVFAQADNRLHTIKAVMLATLIEDLGFIF